MGDAGALQIEIDQHGAQVRAARRLAARLMLTMVLPQPGDGEVMPIDFQLLASIAARTRVRSMLNGTWLGSAIEKDTMRLRSRRLASRCTCRAVQGVVATGMGRGSPGEATVSTGAGRNGTRRLGAVQRHVGLIESFPDVVHIMRSAEK